MTAHAALTGHRCPERQAKQCGAHLLFIFPRGVKFLLQNSACCAAYLGVGRERKKGAAVILFEIDRASRLTAVTAPWGKVRQRQDRRGERTTVTPSLVPDCTPAQTSDASKIPRAIRNGCQVHSFQRRGCRGPSGTKTFALNTPLWRRASVPITPVGQPRAPVFSADN